MSDVPAVIDASALLAFIFDEQLSAPRAAFENGILSTVNLAETLSKMVNLGATVEEAVADVEALGFNLVIADFDRDIAMRAAALRAPTKHLGLSLGDRACLATAQSRDLPVLTADRVWEKVRGFAIIAVR
ncbi:MAG: VapC-like domain ribonuclease toxin [Rhodospirillales bacterium]|jgi:ribonuclease VapC|nr:VapC-like domain ribonuclease toxin [Rhodospirillales bacterium]